MPNADNFFKLFDLLPIGAYRCALDGQLLRANAALARMHGYSDEVRMREAVAQAGTAWQGPSGRHAALMVQLHDSGVVRDLETDLFGLGNRERIRVREYGRLVRDFANDRNTRPARFFRAINEIPFVIAIVIVISVVVKPF